MGLWALLLLLLLRASEASAACDCSTLPSLGAAAQFGALGLGGDKVTLSGSSFALANANVGIGPGGSSVTLSGSAHIDGFVGNHPGTSVSGAAAADGGAIEMDMAQVVHDAIDASAAFAAMTPRRRFPGSRTKPSSAPAAST